MSTAGETDFYGALGVEATCDAAAIKAAYRSLVRQFHPDANPHRRLEAEERIKTLTRAYATLGDPQKRLQYDRDRRLTSSQNGQTTSSGSLLTRVRVALGLSGEACAQRLGMAPPTFWELESRDALPSSPVQSRTFTMLLDNAAKTLEGQGETLAARNLRMDFERKRARQAALR